MSDHISISTVGMLLIAIPVIFLYRRPKMKHGEILPAEKMKEKYNLTAERYTNHHL
jgi:hypothetical protein